jgi:hypothetical protein
MIVGNRHHPLRRRHGVAGAFSPAYHNPVEMTGLYWHFVDIVWIFLYPLLYLIARPTQTDMATPPTAPDAYHPTAPRTCRGALGDSPRLAGGRTSSSSRADVLLVVTVVAAFVVNLGALNISSRFASRS